MALRWHMILRIPLFGIFALFFAEGQENPGADVASAVLGAIFPDLTPDAGLPSSQVQKRQFYPGDFYGLRGREPLDPYLYDRRQRAYAPSYDAFRFSDPYARRSSPSQSQLYDPFSSYGFDRYPGAYSPSGSFGGRDPTDYFGLNPYAGTSRMPTLNYPYSTPRFGRLSNPRVQGELMDGFPYGSQPSGFQGRTDLPPSYVYPFAQPGSLIAPDRLGGDVFGLANNPVAPPRDLLDDYLDSRLDPRLLRRLLPYIEDERRYQPTRPERYRPRFWKRGENETKDAMEDENSDVSKQILSDKQWYLPEDQRDIIGGGGNSKTTKEPKLELLKPKKTTKPDAKENVRRRPEKKVAECGKCLNVNATKTVGRWSQVYGNQKSLELIYSSLATLTLPDEDFSEVDEFFTPQCVSLNALTTCHVVVRKQLLDASVEPYLRKSKSTSMLPLDLTYSIRGTPHTTKGIIQREKSKPHLTLRFGKNFVLPQLLVVCLLKAHESPDDSGYEYMVFSETQGTEGCKNFHVFARDRARFHATFTDEVGTWVRKKASKGAMSPIRLLTHPELCDSASRLSTQR